MLGEATGQNAYLWPLGLPYDMVAGCQRRATQERESSFYGQAQKSRTISPTVLSVDMITKPHSVDRGALTPPLVINKVLNSIWMGDVV